MPRNLTLNDLPKEERPRERLQKYGPEALSVSELLALILGRGVKGEPVMLTAQKLLSKFGSIKGISEASLEDLQSIKGLGLAKAAQIKACFQISRRLDFEENSISKKRKKRVINPGDIFKLVKSKITKSNKEHFLVISLDTRNIVLGIDSVSIGTLNASLVHPRETFETAITRHAAQVIIAHNHPSGDVEPSEGDIETTTRLKEAGELLGIEVIDHLIISKKDFFSFKAKGII
ncbi:MAG TPA: DNA repair protein RadC [Patescibacteria group bacterium]|nr:DNA repair protein RadC [Patescibacteria group bacterium]